MRTKFIIIIALFTLPVNGQEMPTIREIFDFHADDEFHYSEIT